MIIFKKVRYKNFLSTGQQFIEIQLDRSQSTLVVGENGAGKSTMLDALCFGLFQRPFRNIKKDQLINSINEKECVVEVEFVIGQNYYKIIRGIKPNTFEIWCNDVMLNQDAAQRDYQKHLESTILKLNFRSFTQVVILGNASFVPFMQLRARHRRQVVEEILDIEIFSKMNLMFREKQKNQDEIIKQSDFNCQLIDSKIESQKKHIEDMSGNKQQTVDKKMVELEQAQTDIDNYHVVYENNISTNNNGDGFKHEISYDCTIRNNVGFGNYHDPYKSAPWGSFILVQNSSYCDVYGNKGEVSKICESPETCSVKGNGIYILEQSRLNGDGDNYYGLGNAVHRNAITFEAWEEESSQCNPPRTQTLIRSNGRNGATNPDNIFATL